MQKIPLHSYVQDIVNNKGNDNFLDALINGMESIKQKFDWQMSKFLNDHCKGISGLERLNLDTSSPHYRYYNAKCEQYRNIERIIAIANSYKGNHV